MGDAASTNWNKSPIAHGLCRGRCNRTSVSQARLCGRDHETRLAEEIQDFDLAALSPFSISYYEKLGWEPWRGPLLIRTDDGLLPTPDYEQATTGLPNTPELDLDAPLSAEWREGELW